VCPNCRKLAEDAAAALMVEAAALYGKVPAADYEAAMERARDAAKDMPSETFREDYEIYGAQDGTVKVTYGGRCEVCKVGIDFRVERQFWPSPAPEDADASR
jgi:hypothetical protein